MRNLYYFFIFAIVLIFIMCSTMCVSANAASMEGKTEKEMRAYANENNTWVVCYQQGARTSNFYQYDATNEYIYFSYSKHSCVDVYDKTGTFLYTFLFPERQNGGVSVRCENDKVYISTKDNILYIFSGVEEVEHMDYDTAAEKGYDFFWFYNNEPHITVEQKWIYWHDDGGNVVNQIATPSVVSETIPPSGALMTAIPLIAVSLVLLIFIIKVLSQIVSKIRNCGHRLSSARTTQ